MKIIKTKTILKDFWENPIKEGDRDLTVGMAIANILALQTSNPGLSWKLGKEFATLDEVVLKVEDLAYIKKEIEECAKRGHYFSKVAGQLINDFIEGNDKNE